LLRDLNRVLQMSESEEGMHSSKNESRYTRKVHGYGSGSHKFEFICTAANLNLTCSTVRTRSTDCTLRQPSDMEGLYPEDGSSSEDDMPDVPLT